MPRRAAAPPPEPEPEGKDLAAYATKPLTDMMEDYADWASEVTGVDLSTKAARRAFYLGATLRTDFQKAQRDGEAGNQERLRGNGNGSAPAKGAAKAPAKGRKAPPEPEEEEEDAAPPSRRGRPAKAPVAASAKAPGRRGTRASAAAPY